MIPVTRQIETAFDEATPAKMIFKKIQSRLTIFFILPATIIFVSFFFIFNHPVIFHILSILGLFLLFLHNFCYVNPHVKKELFKLGIIPDENYFKSWANENYLNYKFECFKNNLIHKNILTKCENLNKSLLKEYADNFKSKSKALQFNILKIYSVILLFVLPLWVKLLDKLTVITKTHELTSLNYFSFMVVIIILTIIFVLVQYKQIHDRKSVVMDQIAEELFSLQLNIKIEKPADANSTSNR